MQKMKADKTNLDLRSVLLTCLKEIDKLRKRYEMWEAFIQRYDEHVIYDIEEKMRATVKNLEESFEVSIKERSVR